MDLSPLRKFEVLGPDAETLIQKTITRDARKLSVGQVVYTAVCNETGGMIDDATVFRLGDDNFRFIGGDEYDGVWLREIAERNNLHVWIKPTTDQLHNLAVQGPLSRETLKEIVWTPPTQPSLEELKWFRFLVGRINTHDGIPIIVSRTGYTGELGYEVFCHPSDGPAVWDAIFEAGEPRGIKPLGLEALDMLRIESGLIFAGYEFDDQVDPFEAGIGFTVALNNEEDFVGRDALLERKEHPQRRLVGLELDEQRNRRPRRPRLRRTPTSRRRHERHPQPDAEALDRARTHGGSVRRHRHRGRGRQARRAPEADPLDGRADPVL